MEENEKMFVAFEKVMDAVDSCIFKEQTDTAEQLVENFRTLFGEKANVMADYLLYKLNNTRAVIDWLLNKY